MEIEENLKLCAGRSAKKKCKILGTSEYWASTNEVLSQEISTNGKTLIDY